MYLNAKFIPDGDIWMDSTTVHSPKLLEKFNKLGVLVRFTDVVLGSNDEFMQFFFIFELSKIINVLRGL